MNKKGEKNEDTKIGTFNIPHDIRPMWISPLITVVPKPDDISSPELLSDHKHSTQNDLLQENKELRRLYRHEIRSLKKANKEIQELREKIFNMKRVKYEHKNRNGLSE